MSVDYSGKNKTVKDTPSPTLPGAGTAPVGVLDTGTTVLTSQPSPLFLALLTAAVQHSGISYYGHMASNAALKSRVDYLKKSEEKLLRLWALPIVER